VIFQGNKYEYKKEDNKEQVLEDLFAYLLEKQVEFNVYIFPINCLCMPIYRGAHEEYSALLKPLSSSEGQSKKIWFTVYFKSYRSVIYQPFRGQDSR
jgi:hypothetical protein